jgi:hypothetical protein
MVQPGLRVLKVQDPNYLPDKSSHEPTFGTLNVRFITVYRVSDWASLSSTASPNHHIPAARAQIPFANAVIGYRMLPKPTTS